MFVADFWNILEFLFLSDPVFINDITSNLSIIVNYLKLIINFHRYSILFRFKEY
jgi:hypothetical protein